MDGKLPATLKEQIKKAPRSAIFVVPNERAWVGAAVRVALDMERTDITFVFPNWLEHFSNDTERPIMVSEKAVLTDAQRTALKRCSKKVPVFT